MTAKPAREGSHRSVPDVIRVAMAAIDGLKGQDLLALDVRDVNDATDFFVIATGTSDAHVRGIADAVVEALRKEGQRPHHVEGLTVGRWVLLDYVDFVIHLFHPETRAFYQLERLWSDAPELEFSSTT
jgi:ribosome-associated protein